MVDHDFPGRWVALRPLVLSTAVCLPLLSAGFSIGYTGTMLPQIRTASGNSTFTMDADQASWYASMLAATAPFGGLLTIMLLDRLGRKALLLSSNVPALLGWLLVARAPHTSTPVVELYVARGLSGLSLGAAIASCTVYLAEVVAPRSARPLTTFPAVVLGLGVFVVYVLGATLSWTVVAYAAAAAPCLAVVVVAWVLPDSPAWLRNQGRPGDADWALQKLRLPALSSATAQPCPGCSSDSKKHENCLFCAEGFQDPSTPRPEEGNPCKTALQVFFSRAVLRNFAVQVVLVLFQQFNGTFAILAYLVDIVEGLDVTEFGAQNVAILCGALVFSSNVCVGVLEPKFGIRSILLFCSTGMALSMLFLSFHLTLLQVGGPMAVLYYKWIPFAAMLFFVFFGAAWLVVFPWLELGEKFPACIRGTVGYILLLVTFAAYFLNLKYFPGFVGYFKFGMTKVFYYLCLVSTLGTAFGFFFWPKSQHSLVGVMGEVAVTPMYTVLPEEERLLRTDDGTRT